MEPEVVYYYKEHFLETVSGNKINKNTFIKVKIFQNKNIFNKKMRINFSNFFYFWNKIFKGTD